MSETAIEIALLILFLWYLSFTATRLDRLHHRVESSWAALDSLLQRRAAIALEIAHSEFADPGLSLILNQAAHQAREAEISERSDAESGLTSALGLKYQKQITYSRRIDLQNRMVYTYSDQTLKIIQLRHHYQAD